MKIKLTLGLSLFCALFIVSCAKDAEPAQDQNTLESSDPTGLQKINALMKENPDNPDLHYIRGEYFYEMETFCPVKFPHPIVRTFACTPFSCKKRHNKFLREKHTSMLIITKKR